MSSEEQHHVALPKLCGAPAYARPPRPVVATTPRPFDPDDLPLEAFMTPEERALKEAALAGSRGGSGTPSAVEGRPAAWDAGPRLEPRPFRLRALAARLLRVGGPEGDGTTSDPGRATGRRPIVGE